VSYDILRARYCDWPVRAGVKIISEDSGPLIPLETCRQHLELVAIDGDSNDESHPDDALILGFLAAAVDYAEDYTGLSLVERVLEMALDTFPRNTAPIVLKKPPVVEIISFSNQEASEFGSEGEMDIGDNYILDDYQNPPQLLPVSSWPSLTRATNQIKILYRVGYRRELIDGDSENPTSESDAKPLPKAIRQALLLLMGHFYENRNDSVEKALTSIPLGVSALLGIKRIETGFA
jgi:uncharacterized phiE125 gp8 family phage protein